MAAYALVSSTRIFLGQHSACRPHNSLIAYEADEGVLSLSSFFASFFQDLVLACVSSR